MRWADAGSRARPGVRLEVPQVEERGPGRDDHEHRHEADDDREEHFHRQFGGLLLQALLVAQPHVGRLRAQGLGHRHTVLLRLEEPGDQLADLHDLRPILLDEAAKIGLRAERLPAEVNRLLLQLNGCYSEMGQKATTDFDEVRAHSNEIANIWEAEGAQVYYQQDKDWFYRSEERRWITMNDNSGWRRITREGKRSKRSLLHIA